MRATKIGFFWALMGWVVWVWAAPAAAAPAPERALFVSVIQSPPVLESRSAIESLIQFSKQAGVRTLFVQVYRENKSWFASREADDSPYRRALGSVGEDPLALLIRRAHSEGIQVHAWMNLLSLGSNAQAPLLKKHGPKILTRDTRPKTSLAEYRIGNQFFLEPGSLRVRLALRKIVGEVVRQYPALDGIQLDYIRYPDLHPSYGHTKENLIQFYRSAGRLPTDEQSPAWRQWKEKQVTGLVGELARIARRLHPGITVSTTGLSPWYHAYLESFQNWREWVTTGLTDFVTLMVYPPDTAAYRAQIESLKKDMPDFSRVNLAVGAYKQTDTPDVFGEQWDLCRQAGSRACVVFHYGNLLEQPALQKPLLASASAKGNG